MGSDCLQLVVVVVSISNRATKRVFKSIDLYFVHIMSSLLTHIYIVFILIPILGYGAEGRGSPKIRSKVQ